MHTVMGQFVLIALEAMCDLLAAYPSCKKPTHNELRLWIIQRVNSPLCNKDTSIVCYLAERKQMVTKENTGYVTLWMVLNMVIRGGEFTFARLATWEIN